MKENVFSVLFYKMTYQFSMNDNKMRAPLYPLNIANI